MSKNVIVPQLCIRSLRQKEAKEESTHSREIKGRGVLSTRQSSTSRTAKQHGADESPRESYDSVCAFIEEGKDLWKNIGAAVDVHSDAPLSTPLDHVDVLVHLLCVNPSSSSNLEASDRKGIGASSPSHEHSSYETPFCQATYDKARQKLLASKCNPTQLSSSASVSMQFTSPSMTHSVKALRLGLAALLSYRELHKVLQLLRECSPHPVLLYLLNHSSTLSRLTRAQSSHFLQDFISHASEAGTQTSISPTPSQIDDQLLSWHKDLLTMVAPCITPRILAKAVHAIQALLCIGVPLAFEILFSLLLRRKLASPFTVNASIDVYDAALRMDDSKSSFHQSVVSLLRMDFVDVDIQSLDWSLPSVALEVLFVFTDELNAYLDCLTLLSSFNVEPYFEWVRVSSFSQAIQTAPRQCRGRDAAQTRGSGINRPLTWDVSVRLHVLSTLRVYNALNFKGLRTSLWNVFQQLCLLDHKAFDVANMPFVEDGFSSQEKLTESQPERFKVQQSDAIFPDASDGFRCLMLRTVLILSAHVLGCVTGILRFCSHQAGYLSIDEVRNATEFITRHNYSGFLSHLSEYKQRCDLESIVWNSSALYQLELDIHCACVCFVIVVHQHHCTHFSGDSWLSDVYDTLRRTRTISHEFTVFHGLFHFHQSQEDAECDVQSISQVAHALLCADVTHFMNSLSDRADEGYGSEPEEKMLCDYAVSVIPHRCKTFSEALLNLRLTAAPSAPQRAVQTMGLRKLSRNCNQSLLLWEQTDSTLPSFVSLGLAVCNVCEGELLPGVLQDQAAVYCHSVAGVLRLVFFDVIDALFAKVELSECPGVQGILEFCSDLFHVDSSIALQAFRREGGHSTCESTFWTLVVTQFLGSHLPYSLFSMLRLMSSLIPTVSPNSCTAFLRLNKVRFESVVSLLISPLETICFPPLVPGVLPVGRGVPLNDPMEEGGLVSKHEEGARINGAHVSHFKYGTGVTSFHETGAYSEATSGETEALRHPAMYYTLDTPVVVEDVIRLMFGFCPKVSNNVNETCLSNRVGRVVPMPIECLPFMGSVTSPDIAKSSSGSLLGDTVQWQGVGRTRRRYGGPVWAVSAFDSGHDRVQNSTFPVDMESFNNFMAKFKQQRETQMQVSNNAVTQGMVVGLTPNPFRNSRLSNVQELEQEAWLSYQILTLSGTEDPPYTLQWDISSSSFTLYHLIQLLWTSALEKLENTDHTQYNDILHTINLVSQIVQMFSDILQLHPVAYIFLSQCVLYVPCDAMELDTTAEWNFPLKLFLQLFSTLRVTVNLLGTVSYDDAEPNSCVMLLICALNAVVAAMRPVHLDDIRHLVTCLNSHTVVDVMWKAVGKQQCFQLPATLEPLGPATNYLHIHWLFRLLCSSLPGSPVLDGEYIPLLPIGTLAGCIKQCVQSVKEMELSCSLVTVALRLCTCLLELTPLSCWACSSLDEALTESQMTRESIDVLVRFQSGMVGDWNRVDLYLKAFEKSLWQIVTSLLSPCPLMGVDGHGSTPQPGSLATYRKGVSAQLHGAGDFQLFSAVLDMMFSMGWNHACSFARGFNTLERTYLLRHIMIPLTVLIQSINWFNSQPLDDKCASFTYDPDVPFHCILNIRKIQNLTLNALAEHNVIGSIGGLLTFEGYVSVTSAERHKQVTQRFVNTLGVQAYIFDLLSTHKKCNTLALMSDRWGQRVLYATTSTAHTQGLLEDSVRFLLHSCTLAYGGVGLHADMDRCYPSSFFSKLAQILGDLKSTTRLNRCTSCGFADHLKVSLASNDVFEQVDHKFILDMMYERINVGWSFPVNFIMSLIVRTLQWGDGVVSQAPFLINILMKSSVDVERPHDETHRDVPHTDVYGALIPYLLIQHPSELQFVISKGLKCKGESSTKSVWCLLTSLEKTLVGVGVNTFLLIPARLSIMFCPLTLVTQPDGLQPTVLAQTTAIPQLFYLLGDTALRYGLDESLTSVVWQDVVVFGLFWLCRFLLAADLVTTSNTCYVPVTVDMVSMMYVSLEILRQVFCLHHNASWGMHLIKWMCDPCVEMFNKYPFTQPTALPPHIQRMSGWSIIEHVAKLTVPLWSEFDALRYKGLNVKLLSTDISVVEALLGRVAVPSLYGLATCESLFSGSSFCAVMKQNAQRVGDHSDSTIRCVPFDIQLQAVGEHDISFLFHLCLIASFSCVTSLVSSCLTCELTSNPLGMTRPKLQCVSPHTSDPAFHSTVFLTLFESPQFTSLLNALANDERMVSLLLNDQHACLLPAPIASRVSSAWFRFMEKRDLFSVLPSPICTTCSTEPFHPFHTTHGRWVPVDCFLVNARAGMFESSSHILNNVLTLVFGHTNHTTTREKKPSSASQRPRAAPPCASGCQGDELLGHRAMVFQLQFVLFAHHLWDKVVERHANQDMIASLSVEQVQEYMFDAFGLTELMSVLSDEIRILREKHTVLSRLSSIYVLTRNFNAVLHCCAAKDKRVSTVPHNGNCTSRFFTVYLKPSLCTMLHILDSRQDLCGRGRDFLFCPGPTLPESSSTYVGVLMDFIIQQLVGNGCRGEESGCRRSMKNLDNKADLQATPCVEILESTGNAMCLSSLWQLRVPRQHRGSSESTRNLFIFEFPGADLLSLLDNCGDNDIYDVLERLMQKLCDHLLTTIRLCLAHQDVSSTRVGFQNFTDLCRALTLCHLIIRCWVVGKSLRALSGVHEEFSLKPLVYIFHSVLAILPCCTTALIKSVVMYKNDVNLVAQLMCWRSGVLEGDTVNALRASDNRDTARSAQSLHTISVPFLLMSLCCTILDVIAATSTLHWKHSSASKEHQRPQRLALLNDFIHQVDATANSDTGWTLIRILTVIKTLSKLPKDSFKVIDAAHLQSKHTTSLLQNIVASHPTYRSIWVSSQNYAQRFNVHMSLICLSLLNYVLMVPAPLRNADESSVASTLCLLSGAQLFTRPLVKSDVVSVPRTTRTGYDPQDNGTLDGRWRPVYERFFWLDPTLVEQDPLFFDQTSNVLSSTAFLSIGSSNTMLHPSRPLRSKFHIVWCQCLAQMSHLQGQCLVDFIVRFQHRFFFVLDTVAQSSQLGILEECLFMLRLFAKLPAFSTLLSLDDKQTILNLVLTTLKTVSHLTQLCLGRSQIEMAETFKPVSPREISGAGLLDVFGVDSVADKCVDSRMTILSGQPALVPSLFHQRVIVLVIKLIQNTLLCTCRLKWEQLGTAELDGLNLRRSVTRSANYAENNSVSSCEKNATVAGDILETIFHDVLDIGRLILQVLEDLPKLQKRIFIGICPQSNNHVILPLSFALHVESHCTAESIAQWLATHPNSATAKDPDICDHFNASYDEMHCVTSPAGCASHSTPQATDKLRDPIHSSCPPFSATRHLSQATGGGVFRHPSPLSAQRSALGATAHRGTTTSFIRSHGLFELYERVIVRSEGQDEADPVTDDCLPMCVTFPSVLRVLHYIVADSVFVGFTCFNRLTSMTQETSCVGPSGTHGHPSIFERPSVVRRLTEFLTALQTTGVDKLRSLHGIIKKMMKVISLRLGDDPKMLQRER